MFVELSNTPRPYPWGDSHSISSWQNRPVPQHPEAELWLGTHPGSEAFVVQQATTEPMSSWLSHRGLSSGLPYLVKLLAAGQPLSIQVHPTKAQAQQGFAREEAAGIPLDAPDRNYRDQSDKPEVMIAWSDQFLALVGFQTQRDAEKTLESLAHHLGDTAVAEARASLALGIEGLVNWLFSGAGSVKALAVALSETWRPNKVTTDSSPLERVWAAVIPLHPGDPGILAASFMNLVELDKGEALFVPAGIVHAYLAGFGLEVMAPSDNVLRGGLTPKHIDLDELASVVEPVSFTDVRLVPENHGARQVFAPPGAPFSILHATGQSGELVSAHVSVGAPSIVVGHAGHSVLRDGSKNFDIAEGHAYLWVPEGSHQTLSGSGSVYVVSGVTG